MTSSLTGVVEVGEAGESNFVGYVEHAVLNFSIHTRVTLSGYLEYTRINTKA